MNDRELLEMAAKANNDPKIYKDIGEFYRIIGRNEDIGCDVLAIWSPLNDDGDAFRLAVKLQIEIEHAELAVIATHRAYNWGWLGEGVNEDHGDRYAATRRVIVRAAAEIGRNMK